MLLVPLVVFSQNNTSRDLLMASNLQLVEVGKMSFGADVGKKVGHVTELCVPWRADATTEELCRHDAMMIERPKEYQGSNQWMTEW